MCVGFWASRGPGRTVRFFSGPFIFSERRRATAKVLRLLRATGDPVGVNLKRRSRQKVGVWRRRDAILCFKVSFGVSETHSMKNGRRLQLASPKKNRISRRRKASSIRVLDFW